MKPASGRLTPFHPLWHALRHAPRAQRELLFTLYELGEQIAETPERVTEPGIAAMKLAWWHEEIERLVAAQARHPLCQQLQDRIAPQRLAWLQNFVHAQEQRLAPPPRDIPALLEQADRQATLERIAAIHCGDDSDNGLRCGRFRYLVEALNRIGAPLRRDRSPFPLTPAHDSATLLQQPEAEFNTALAPVLSLIDELTEPPPRHAPALLRALHSQTHALYRAIRENPAQCRQQTTVLTPLALFWHGWRGVLLAK